jgi:hypothetical protein
MKLNVGGGKHKLPGWTNLDRIDLENVDIVHDLNSPEPIPVPNGSVDSFLLSHVLEHIPDTLHVMQKLWVAAKPGADITIACPYAFSDESIEDQTHVRFFVENSCCFFSQPVYCNADYGYKGDWQFDTVVITVMAEDVLGDSDEVVKKRVKKERNLGKLITYYGEAVKPARPQKVELVSVPVVVIHRV